MNNLIKQSKKVCRDIHFKFKEDTIKRVYSAIDFLFSQDANCVVGQNIYVDGGFSSW